MIEKEEGIIEKSKTLPRVAKFLGWLALGCVAASIGIIAVILGAPVAAAAIGGIFGVVVGVARAKAYSIFKKLTSVEIDKTVISEGKEKTKTAELGKEGKTSEVIPEKTKTTARALKLTAWILFTIVI